MCMWVCVLMRSSLPDDYLVKVCEVVEHLSILISSKTRINSVENSLALLSKGATILINL